MWEKWTSFFIFQEYLKITPKFWWLCWRTSGHTCVPCFCSLRVLLPLLTLNFFFLFAELKKFNRITFFYEDIYIYTYIFPHKQLPLENWPPFVVVVYSWKRTPEDKIVTHGKAFIYECMIFQSCTYQKIWQYVQVHISKECIYCFAYLRFCCVNEGYSTASFIFL